MINKTSESCKTTHSVVCSKTAVKKAKSVSESVRPNSKDVVEQMIDGIVGKESEDPTEREIEIRKNLSGRALEYLMFMDDED